MRLRNRVALRIRTIRKRRGLTQTQLAERIDRTSDAVSQLERGLSLPNFETLERLGAALDVPIRDFFDAENTDTDHSPRSVKLMASLMDLARGLSEDDLEIAVQMADALAAKSKKPAIVRGRKSKAS